MFSGKLRKFQEQMCLFMMNKKKCINASGTGLGKSVEVIAAAEKLFELGLADKCIVISLSTLKEQWIKRISEFSTHFYVMIDGTESQKARRWKLALSPNVKYIVLNYEALVARRSNRNGTTESRRVAPLWDVLDKFKHERCIIACDEGTKIKNFRSKTAQRIKTLYARWMWVLTATPIENTPDELFSIMEWIRRGALGTYGQFKQEYVNFNFFGGVEGYKNLDKLHEVVKPFLLRHTREMVKDQLPELVFKDKMCDMDDAKKVYDFVRDDLLSVMEGVGTTVDLTKFDPDAESDSTMTQVIQRYTALRMICQSPQILKHSDSPYAKYLVENKIITDQVGGKLGEIADTIEGILNEEPKNKVVLFNYFKNFIWMLQCELEKRKIPVLLYTGDQGKDERNRAQELFNTNPKKRTILCSDAGGYGVDLPSGTHVINSDLPWHPGKLDQRNRTQRISSKHTTNTILTITARNTVEARMYDTVLRKRIVSEAILDGKHKDMKDEFKLNSTTLHKFLTGE